MRAIIIDPFHQSISECDIDMSLASLQTAVGGPIEYAFEFENGDVLYVNEEGLLRSDDAMSGKDSPEFAHLFDVEAHQPFAGRGLVVGAEDEHGKHGDAQTTVRELSARLAFLVPEAFVKPSGSTEH